MKVGLTKLILLLILSYDNCEDHETQNKTFTSFISAWTHDYLLCKKNAHFKLLRVSAEETPDIAGVATSRRLQCFGCMAIMARVKNFGVEACWTTATGELEKKERKQN